MSDGESPSQRQKKTKERDHVWATNTQVILANDTKEKTVKDLEAKAKIERKTIRK